MQTYSEYQPTGFDPKGLALDSQQDWLVLPCGRNRDSSPLDESNFETALESLGGESDNVEVHRFGHWANGWFEIIIVRPGTPEALEAEDIESSLADYPVLDDMDSSRREHEAYIESWESWGAREFRRDLVKKFDLDAESDEALPEIELFAGETGPDTRTDDEKLDEISDDSLLEFFESMIPSGEYHDYEGACNVRYAVENCGESDVRAFIDSHCAPWSIPIDPRQLALPL